VTGAPEGAEGVAQPLTGRRKTPQVAHEGPDARRRGQTEPSRGRWAPSAACQTGGTIRGICPCGYHRGRELCVRSGPGGRVLPAGPRGRVRIRAHAPATRRLPCRGPLVL